MNFRIISAMAFKVYAIYVLVSLSIALPTFYVLIVKSQDGPYTSMGIGEGSLVTLATLAIGVILFQILWRIGRSVLKNTAELGINEEISAYRLLKVLLVALGVYFLVSGIISLPGEVYRVWYFAKSGSDISFSNYGSTLALIIQLAIGISLILKVEGWFKFINRYLVLN